MGVLFINPKDVRFWHELYGRTDEEMNGKFVIRQAVVEGPEFVAPIDSAEEDPALLSGSMPSIPLPPSPSPSPSPSPAVSATSSKTGLQRTEFPTPSSSSEAVTPLPASPVKTRHESLRPFDTGSLASAFSLKTTPGSHLAPRSPSPAQRPASSSRASPTPPATAELFSAGAGGMRSMWGKLSSNASAAFSVVQDAYGSVTQDMKGLSLAGGTGSPPNGGELKTKEEISTWSGGRPSSPSRRSSTISYTIGRTSNPWSTNTTRHGPSVPSMLMDNPWSTARPSAPDHPALGDAPFRPGSQSEITPATPAATESRSIPPPSQSLTPTSTSTPGSSFLDPIPLPVASSKPATDLSANQWTSTGTLSQAQTDSESSPPRPPQPPPSDPLGVGFS